MMKKLIAGSLILTSALSYIAPALATSTSTTSTSTTPRKPELSSSTVVCVQNAVTKRETAIITAQTTFSTSMTTALTKRKNALVTAWGLTDPKARRTARQSAWDTFRKEKKEARKTQSSAVKSAWGTFYSEGKTCGMNVRGTEPHGEDNNE